jgi:hypothetical protein
MAKERGKALWLAAVLLLAPGAARSELSEADLKAIRTVAESEWLRLRLEVLGLRLSFPAYRIDLGLSQERRIEFTFLASGGLAEHLRREVGRGEAQEVLTYHARGIRDQVDNLLREEFAHLWSAFDARQDFAGRFLGPGERWDDPPQVLGAWREDSFSWEP